MKWLGYRQVPMKSILVNAPDIKRRTKLADVGELAEDIRTAGEEPIHAPTIRKGSNALLCGRDRFAALLTLKAKRIWVHVAECDDREARQLELRENIFRRPVANRAEQLAELVALKEQEIRAASGGSDLPMQRVKSEARASVAKSAGVSREAVKSAEKRTAAKRESAKDVAPVGHGAQGDPATGRGGPHETPEGGDDLPAFEPEAPTLPKAFDTFGIDPTEINVQQTIDTITNLGMWDQQVRALLSYLTRFEGKGAALAGGHAQAIREAFQGAGHAIRNAIPVRLCFYCKGRADLRGSCFACGQTGVMGRNDGENAPAELRQKGTAAMVTMGGTFAPYGDYLFSAGDRGNRATPKAAKRVSVQDEAGRELVIDRAEAQ